MHRERMLVGVGYRCKLVAWRLCRRGRRFDSSPLMKVPLLNIKNLGNLQGLTLHLHCGRKGSSPLFSTKFCNNRLSFANSAALLTQLEC